MALNIEKSAMQNNNKILSVDDMMDLRFGKVGTPKRESFRNDAYNYCVDQIISDAQKREKVTQQEMVKESFTNAYQELLAGKVKHDARNLF